MHIMNKLTFSHVSYPTDYVEIAVKKVKNSNGENGKCQRISGNAIVDP